MNAARLRLTPGRQPAPDNTSALGHLCRWLMWCADLSLTDMAEELGLAQVSTLSFGMRVTKKPKASGVMTSGLAAWIEHRTGVAVEPSELAVLSTKTGDEWKALAERIRSRP